VPGDGERCLSRGGPEQPRAFVDRFLSTPFLLMLGKTYEEK